MIAYYTHYKHNYSTFRENSGRHGTLSVAHVPLKLSGTVLFENNIGQSLQVSVPAYNSVS